jgi:hypothetical protein
VTAESAVYLGETKERVLLPTKSPCLAAPMGDQRYTSERNDSRYAEFGKV